MDLKKFVTQSLVEIMIGLKDAQDQLHDSHARICPTLGPAITPGGQNVLLGLSTQNRPIALIEYDVAIEVGGDSGASGEIKLAAGIVSGGFFGKGRNFDKTVSRLKFSVPVTYPDIAD